MTTQTCRTTLVGADNGGTKALNFTATCTDDQWNTLKDSVYTLDLFEVLKGQTIYGMRGSYTAGAGIIRVRNTISNKVKVLECLPMLKGEHYQPFRKPFVVEDQDVIECFSTVAGS
jgi:hypothetical protein